MTDTSNATRTMFQREVEIVRERPRLGSGHRRLGRALNVLLAGCAAVSVLRLMLDLYGMVLFKGWQNDPSGIIPADGRNFDTVDQAFSGLWLLAVLATSICAVTWLFRAYGSREADPDLLTFRRWWVIGAWLIPIISLVRPFQLFRDLYAATSAPPPDRGDTRVTCPVHFRWWWGCFMLGNLLANIAFSLLRGDPGFGRIQASLTVDVFSQLSLVAAAVFFAGVLRSVTSNLWDRSQDVT
jgi:hypothetical protein